MTDDNNFNFGDSLKNWEEEGKDKLEDVEDYLKEDYEQTKADFKNIVSKVRHGNDRKNKDKEEKGG